MPSEKNVLPFAVMAKAPKRRVPAAPSHLTKSGAGRELWRNIHSDFVIDDKASLAILQVACEAADRAQQARKEIEKHGIVTINQYGCAAASPLLLVERQSRNQLLSALKRLGVSPN